MSRITWPSLCPHLTLTSGITGSEGQIIDLFRSCAEAQSPSIYSEKVDFSGNYFRAITVGYSLREDLKVFRQKVRQSFQLEASAHYHPHLQLSVRRTPDDAVAKTRLN